MDEHDVADLGRARYWVKRRAGISARRSDGSERSEQTDINATAAEKYAADVLGCEFNDSITVGGDGGYDFVFPLTVEVIWLGLKRGTVEPRLAGHLIVNPDEPHRWADIYVVVRGDAVSGFEIVGWTTHHKLSQQPLKDFGYGQKMAMPTEKLAGINRLLSLKTRDGDTVTQ